MSYKLFLDDERLPPKGDWVICRSSKEAIMQVQKHGIPDFISFDHDLGGNDTSIKFVNWLIETAMYLIDLGADRSTLPFPRNYYIHSQNPVGVANIASKMQCFIFYLDKL